MTTHPLSSIAPADLPVWAGAVYTVAIDCFSVAQVMEDYFVQVYRQGTAWHAKLRDSVEGIKATGPTVHAAIHALASAHVTPGEQEAWDSARAALGPLFAWAKAKVEAEATP